ncbi:MAG TPA: protein-export chaperone SecB [Devosiaceae bacterium]|jgi:preprotein translocase subunit SecB|nr:protein-export chaperone SecB [Devosiaceae bacterium]
MADENSASPTPAGSNNSAAPGPSYNLIGQYIRDLSFENPGAPGSILAGGASPQFSVSINVSVKKQSDDVYAVELLLNAKAERESTVLFNVELAYGGVFRVRNVAENQLAPLLMVECPRLVFPFARQVLANTVQQGGFPPLMMEPVDFQALYIQNLRNLQAQQQKAAGTAPAEPETPKTN